MGRAVSTPLTSPINVRIRMECARRQIDTLGSIFLSGSSSLRLLLAQSFLLSLVRLFGWTSSGRQFRGQIAGHARADGVPSVLIPMLLEELGQGGCALFPLGSESIQYCRSNDLEESHIRILVEELKYLRALSVDFASLIGIHAGERGGAITEECANLR